MTKHFTLEQKRFLYFLTLPHYKGVPIGIRLFPRFFLMRCKEIQSEVFDRNIRSKEDLCRHIDSLLSSPYISMYNYTRLCAKLLDPNQYDHLFLDMLTKDFKFAAPYFFDRLSSGGILAYFIADSLYYLRMGIAVGLISKYSAQSLFFKLADLASSNYSSWEDYFMGYYVGYQFVNEKGAPYNAMKNYGQFAAVVFSGRMPDWNTKL